MTSTTPAPVQQTPEPKRAFMPKTTLSRQLATLAAIVILAFAGYGLWSIGRLKVTAVNGPSYERIKLGLTLDAQMSPPDLNILESYLVVNQMLRATGALARESYIDQLSMLRKRYQDGHDFWKTQNLPPNLADLLLVDSYEPARSFFDVTFDSLVPALNDGNAAATTDAMQQISGYFASHEEAAALTLEEIRKLRESEEAKASSVVSSTITSMIAILVALLLVVGGWLFYTGRSVLRILGGEPEVIKQAVKQLSQGDLRIKLMLRNNDTGSVMAGIVQMRDQIAALVRDIQRAGIQVTSSSTQLLASSQELKATINQQVASTREVTASSQQISATREDLQTTMADVAALTNQTAQAAGQGQNGIRRMTATMETMETASREIGQKLSAINEKVTNITSVVTTINKIADQTNLLSLNASIEAAKAGEYGQGFSVVAREIRRLADQTAVATLDIEKMVKDMQSSVSSGVMGMEKFAQDVQSTVTEVTTIGSQVTQIIEQIQGLSPRIESVNHGMESQSVGANQILEAMNQLGQSTMATAQSQRELEQVTEGLKGAAAELHLSVQQFALDR
jgi:methyl-accepting chemotaxis protein WspA